MQLYRCLVLNNCQHNCSDICIYVTSQDLFISGKKTFQKGFFLLSVLVIKCLCSTAAKNNVCIQREICMLEKDVFVKLWRLKPFNKSVHGRLYHLLLSFLPIDMNPTKHLQCCLMNDADQWWLMMNNIEMEINKWR